VVEKEDYEEQSGVVRPDDEKEVLDDDLVVSEPHVGEQHEDVDEDVDHILHLFLHMV
jgi:hypothetical protein